MQSAQTLPEDGTPHVQEYEEVNELAPIDEIQSNHQSRDYEIREEEEAHE